MKIAVISDSHRNQQYVVQFLDQLREIAPDLVIHLGDDYDDALPIMDAGYATIRVPGTWSSYYQDPFIENRRFETFEGWRFFLTHTPEPDSHDLPTDIDPCQVIQDQDCDVFLHGHTHYPKIQVVNDVMVINPGHTKAEMDRGSAPSYAVIDLTKNTINVTIKMLLESGVVQAYSKVKEK